MIFDDERGLKNKLCIDGLKSGMYYIALEYSIRTF